jgi:hypothetical protein
MRMPLSKQRNKHIQRALVEAAETGAETESRISCDLRQGEAERKWQSGDTCRSPEDGYLSARRGPATTRVRARGRTRDHGSLSTAENRQEDPVRRLPGPADCRLSEGSYTPEALYELFRDWQRTQTQSSATALRSLRQQMDVWFCRAQEPMPRGTLCVLNILDRMTCTLSRACPGHPCLRLTDDLHGGWQTGLTPEFGSYKATIRKDRYRAFRRSCRRLDFQGTTGFFQFV